MADSVKKIVRSQMGIRGALFPGTEYDNVETLFNSDQLFQGVWRLNQSNLNKFDPFITGYAFFIWTKAPRFWQAKSTDSWTNFKALTENNLKAFDGLADMNLNYEDVTHGIAGNAYPVPTNMTKENTTFTLRHIELAGSPIREGYTFWVTGIRDPETGLATYHGTINDQISGTTANSNGSAASSSILRYSQMNHTGEAIYIVTDPSGARGGAHGIEHAVYYTNVEPNKVPLGHMNYTAGEHGISELDFEYRCCAHWGAAVNELAVNVMKAYFIALSYCDYAPGGAIDEAYPLTDANITTGYNEKMPGYTKQTG